MGRNDRIRRFAVVAAAAAACTLMPVGGAYAATTAEPAAEIMAAPKWCGHNPDWTQVGDWLYRFQSHWNEGGGRHIHYYQYRHAYIGGLDGQDHATC